MAIILGMDFPGSMGPVPLSTTEGGGEGNFLKNGLPYKKSMGDILRGMSSFLVTGVHGRILNGTGSLWDPHTRMGREA